MFEMLIYNSFSILGTYLIFLITFLICLLIFSIGNAKLKIFSKKDSFLAIKSLLIIYAIYFVPLVIYKTTVDMCLFIASIILFVLLILSAFLTLNIMMKKIWKL